MSPGFETADQTDTGPWIDEAETITWAQMLEVQRIMDEQAIPKMGRKLLSQDGVMVMDERPLVSLPFPRHGGGPRVSKHLNARKQRRSKK